MSLSTGVDRTLYFDFLPVKLPKLRGYTVRVQLYTVPGQVHYNSTRKLVLTGADGIVFVADSQRPRREANIESFQNLQDNLREQGLSLERMPHLLQYNKRDMPDLLPVAGARRGAQPAPRADVRDLGDHGRGRVRGAQVDHHAGAVRSAAARRVARRRRRRRRAARRRRVGAPSTPTVGRRAERAARRAVAAAQDADDRSVGLDRVSRCRRWPSASRRRHRR